MALFGNKPNKGGLWADMIMSPEQDRNWLIYKWRPEGEEAGSTKRENSIRWTSSLTVRQGEIAVFQYGGKEAGGKQDYIEGYFSDTVKTANLPILSSIVGAAFGGGSPFPAQVYFINLAGVNQVQFGVPYFSMFDPRLPDHPVDVAVRGTITFKIVDYKNFVGMHALVDFDLEKFRAQIKDSVISYVQDALQGDIQGKLGKPLIQINTYRREIKDILQSDLGTSLLNTYGVTLSELNLSAIEIDQESEGYQQLSRVTRAATSAKLEAEIELSQRGIRDQYEVTKLNNEAMAAANRENYAAQMAINREESQHAMRQQTDMNAYAQKMQADMGGLQLHQLKTQEEIAKAQAAAMGQMGQGMSQALGSAGAANLGGGGSGGGGFNPGAMMAGMAVGGAMGQGLSGMMGNAFNQMNQPPMPGAGGPPPMPGVPPAIQFNVSVNGQNYGPYDMTALAQMAGSGQLNAQSMVWRQGMAAWQEAGTVPELMQLFAGVPPPPPPSSN